MATYRKHHITRWRSGWRYKRRVPKNMVPLIGIAYWSKYLGPISEPDAVVAGRKLDVEHDDLIAHLNAMPDTERREIAKRGGLPAIRYEARHLEGWLPHYESRHNGRRVEDIDLEAPDALAQLKSVRDGRKASDQIKRQIATRRALVERASTKPSIAKMEALTALWLKVSPPRDEKTIERRHLYVRRFVACVGDLSPDKVTRQHVIKFRDALEAEGQSRSNIQAHLIGLHTLFGVAVSEGKLDGNPSDGVRVAKRPGEKFSARRKKHFTGEQVAALFKAADGYNFGEGRSRVPAGRADDMRMILRLLAYHGARSGEIVQLRPGDVTTIAGVPVLLLTDEEEDSSVKTANAMREVPIHPSCMDIVAKAAAMKGKPWLFMSLTRSKDKAHWFQEQARRFLRNEVGIADKKLTMHSLRHTWRTVAREIDMPESVSRAIMGHSTGRDVHAGYGGQVSLAKRALWMGKVDPLKA